MLSGVPHVLCKSLWWLSGTGTEAKLGWIQYGNGSVSCLQVDNSSRLNTECISVNSSLAMHSKDPPSHTVVAEGETPARAACPSASLGSGWDNLSMVRSRINPQL